MKKLIVSVLALAMLFAFTSCAASAPAASSAASADSAKPAESAEAAEPALDYPTDDIKIIVPYGTGGANDILARVLAATADKNYFNGNSFVVENMEGGGAAVGQFFVAKSAPADGYTLLLYTTATINNTYLKDDVGYTYEDFKPIIGCNTDAQVLAVPADSPYNSLEELYAAAEEETLLCSTSGFGSGTHNLPMYMEHLMGIKFDYIHGESGAIQLTNVMGNHCDFALFTVSEIMSAYNEGQIKVLGVMSEERDPFLPEVPTFLEQGYEGWVDGSQRAIGCRADMPEDVYNYLVEEFTKLCSSQEYIDAMNEVGMAPMLQSPEEYQEYIDYKVEQMEVLAPIIKQGA